MTVSEKFNIGLGISLLLSLLFISYITGSSNTRGTITADLRASVKSSELNYQLVRKELTNTENIQSKQQEVINTYKRLEQQRSDEIGLYEADIARRDKLADISREITSRIEDSIDESLEAIRQGKAKQNALADSD